MEKVGVGKGPDEFEGGYYGEVPGREELWKVEEQWEAGYVEGVGSEQDVHAIEVPDELG